MITISAGARLRTLLPGLAADTGLVIDYFASARCGVVIGDLTARFAKAPVPDTYDKVAELEGVPVFAERELVPLLEQTALALDRSSVPLFRGLVVRLDQPERWLDFLDRPWVAPRASKRFGGG